MKKRIVAFLSAIGVITCLGVLFYRLEITEMDTETIIHCLKSLYGEIIFIWLISLFAAITFFYQLEKWIWNADYINRKNQHVKLLGSIMFLLWTIGWQLFLQAFLYFPKEHQFVNAELLLRSAIASLNMFVLDIDSNILDEIKQYPELKGAISFVSLLSFLCTIGLLLSLISERLWAYIKLRWINVNCECPHLYVFFGLNKETEILAKDVKCKDSKSIRIVVEQTGKENDDDKGGWSRVVNIITHRTETFKTIKDIDAQLSLTNVNLSEIDACQKDVFAEANLGLVKKKICRLAKIKNKENRKLHIFFLSDNEEQNILSTSTIREDDTIKKISSQGVKVVIYCHARYDSINRVIEESSPLKNVEVRVIDSSHLSIELLKRNVDNHPVKYVEIDGKDNPGTVKSAFNSLVVGMGATGRDAVRFLYEYGAFMSNDSNNDTVKRSEFHCYIVDKDMTRKEGIFMNTASEAIKAKNRDGSSLLNFIHVDTGSAAFFELLHRIAMSLNYVVIAIGTDVENMTLAVRIIKCLMAEGNNLRKTRILVRICNKTHIEHFSQIATHYNLSIGQTCIEVFGAYHNIFSYSLVVEDKFKEEAKLFYSKYQEMMQEKEPALQNGTWEERHDELLGFCHKVVKEIPTNAALQRYNEGKPVNDKMEPTGLSIGFEYVDVERVNYPQYKNLRKLRRQTEQDMSNACHTLTKRELMERAMPQDYSFNDLHQKIQQLKNPQKGTEYFHKYDSLGNKVCKLILNLAITEHLRWSASHEMLGYKKGNKTDEQRQLHNCLVAWEELDKVSCQSCKDATERLENGETWDYDFSKHIKENYPHYKNKVKAYVLFLPDYKRFDFGVVETTIALLKEKENRRDQ